MSLFQDAINTFKEEEVFIEFWVSKQDIFPHFQAVINRIFIAAKYYFCSERDCGRLKLSVTDKRNRLGVDVVNDVAQTRSVQIQCKYFQFDISKIKKEIFLPMSK